MAGHSRALVSSEGAADAGVARRVKRLIDVGVSAVSLAVLSPLIGLVALAIRSVMGRPVIYRDVRPGHRAEPFVIYKFRTMRPVSSGPGTALEDDQRVTRLGYFLRQTSLDELPQLWNVLKGDMSLVGPRPLMTEYLPRYNAEQARRHEVRPGLTGLAQVSGRHGLSWEERFALDVWYIDHWSLGLDLKIMALTVPKLFAGSGMPPPSTEDFGAPGSENRPQ